MTDARPRPTAATRRPHPSAPFLHQHSDRVYHSHDSEAEENGDQPPPLDAGCESDDDHHDREAHVDESSEVQVLHSLGLCCPSHSSPP